MLKITSKKIANNGSKHQQKALEELGNALMKGIGVNPRCVVYDDFGGAPLIVSYIGDRWWVTTPGEKLQPLEEYIDTDGFCFCYLCDYRGKVGALALAKMLGKALENPEDKVDESMLNRVESLKRLGVTLDVKDEPLLLELDTIANENYSIRQGNYSIICHLHGNYCETLFDIDAFDTKREAEEWASYYFDTLENLGVEFKIA